MIGVNDYSVREDGQRIGRIRYAKERTPGDWLWNVTVTIPGPPYGDAKDINQAKERFEKAWSSVVTVAERTHSKSLRRIAEGWPAIERTVLILRPFCGSDLTSLGDHRSPWEGWSAAA
jgi:hypothetical protein